MSWVSHSLEGGPELRVAWVLNELELGGTTTYFLNYIRWLSHHGIKSWVISFRPTPPAIASQFQFSGVTLEPVLKVNRIFEDQVAEVLSRLARIRPQTVVTNGGAGAAGFEVLRYVPPEVKRIGVVLVDQPEGYSFIANYSSHLDALVSISKGLVLRMLEYPALRKVPQHLWIPGIVEEPSLEIRAFPLEPQKLKVLYLGRFEKEQKRVHLLPEIARRTKEAGVPIELTAVGGGTASTYLREAVLQLGNESYFKVHSPEKWDQVKERMLSHDIFLLPSDYEGSPLALLEAMTCGMVPVISDLPTGIRDVVDEKSAMLVPPDEVAGYSEAIIRLWNEPALGCSITKEVKKIIARGFTGEILGPKWKNVLARKEPLSEEPNWTRKVKILPVVQLKGPQYRPLFRPIRRLCRSLQTFWPL